MLLTTLGSEKWPVANGNSPTLLLYQEAGE